MSQGPKLTYWVPLIIWSLLFIIIALECMAGCATVAPAPRHVQYGIYPQVNPPGFYGVDSETKEKSYKAFSDASMAGGQCLNAPDYKAMADYVQYLIDQAKQRCK